MKKFRKAMALCVAIAMLIGTVSFDFSTVRAAENTNDLVYLDSVSGSDANDGLSETTAVKTFDKALAMMRPNGKIKVKSFDKANIVMSKAGTIEIVQDVQMSGSGTGITLKSGGGTDCRKR